MNNSHAIFDNAVMPLFTARSSEWIGNARAAARRIAAERGQVTIDDVRAVCPPPDGADPRIMGSVFAQKGVFERIGFVASSRDACHGRIIGVFRLKDAG